MRAPPSFFILAGEARRFPETIRPETVGLRGQMLSIGWGFYGAEKKKGRAGRPENRTIQTYSIVSAPSSLPQLYDLSGYTCERKKHVRPSGN